MKNKIDGFINETLVYQEGFLAGYDKACQDMKKKIEAMKDNVSVESLKEFWREK